MLWSSDTKLKSNLRHELKYIVDLKNGERFLKDISNLCYLDKHSGSNGFYEVSSLYYDTDDFRFYWDRQESVGYRRKLRLRTYSNSAVTTPIFLEIKEKHKQLVGKKKCYLQDFTPDKDIFNYTVNELLSYVPQSDARQEVEFLHRRLDLRPVINIRYLRTALFSKLDPSLRITLDRRLTAGSHNLFNLDEADRPILSPTLAILELKTSHNLPVWLMPLISKYSFRRTKFSKYCVGAELMGLAKEKQLNKAAYSFGAV